jgi:hypothetical protein
VIRKKADFWCLPDAINKFCIISVFFIEVKKFMRGHPQVSVPLLKNCHLE